MRHKSHFAAVSSLLIAFVQCLSIQLAHADRAAPWVGVTLEGAPCRGRGQGYGPFDYTQRQIYAKNLEIVERFHFTPEVEQLIRGTSGKIPGDIDYTLSAWPNHHRALNAISRYDLGYPNKRHQPIINVECYFQRGIAYSPNDSISMLLYGIYLHKSGEHQLALETYRAAEKIAPNEPQIQYNLALLLVELKEYDQAEQYAVKLYEKQFPLQGLRRQLRAKGYLVDE